MNPSPESPSTREERVNEAIAAYLEAAEAGQAPLREEFLARHPDLADELRAFLDDRGHFARAAGRLTATGPAPAPAAGRRFGDYELLERIAEGGMGVVFRARQVSLNRTVAVKMIRAGQLASAAEVQRFRNEAEAAANLDHPNIVPIYEVGEHAGQHYFSMAYVEGGSLAARVEGERLPPRAAAALVAALARALQFAHDRGVVHRDLKPANILLDCQGVPKVSDFGLAKRSRTGDGPTAPGDILGTASYMPPEQAAGKANLVGPLADVYGLGATLYALLAGRPPFQAGTELDTLLQVLEEAPPRLQALNPAVPRDLETICLKCLEKRPEHRYATAQDLADDLDRFLRCEPIRARPPGVLRRASAWARRRLWLQTGTAALLLLTGVCLSYGLWARAREGDWNVLYLEAQVARLKGRPDAATARLRQAARLRPDARLYDEAVRAVRASGKAGQRVVLPPKTAEELGGDPGVPGMSVNLPFGTSQDRRLLLLPSYDRAGCVVVDRATGGIRWRSATYPDATALDPQGRFVAEPGTGAAPHGAVVQLWDLTGGQAKASLPVGGSIGMRLCFDPQGRRLAVATAEHPGGVRVAVWDVDPPRPVSDTGAVALPDVREVAFSPNGRWLATLHKGENGIRVWDAATGRQRAFWPTPQLPQALAFDPGGSALACLSCADTDGTGGLIEVRDTGTGEVRGRLSLQPPDSSPWYERERYLSKHDFGTWGPLAYTPDGKFLIAVVSTDNREKTRAYRVLLWRVATGEEYVRLPGQRFAVCGTGPDYTLLTLGGEESISLPRTSGRQDGAPGNSYAINDWHLHDVGDELDATGLASCLHAPAADVGRDEFRPPYPFDLLAGKYWRGPGGPELLIYVLTVSSPLYAVGLCSVLGRLLQRRRLSSPTLAGFAGVGLVTVVWGFYFLITMLNTPGQTWWDFGLAFAVTYGALMVGIQLLVRVGRAYHAAVFALDGSAASSVAAGGTSSGKRRAPPAGH